MIALSLSRSQGKVHKWHEDVQIFLAAFSVTYKQQFQYDEEYNNHTVSDELKDILEKARALLCDIEIFVNATANRNNKSKPYWFDKEEMESIVKTLKKKGLKPLVNNIFVKARFQSYIDKLHKRIMRFNLDSNLKTLDNPRARNPLRNRLRKNKGKGAKNRVEGKHKRRFRTTPANGKLASTTMKTFIVRDGTLKMHRRNKGTKIPRQRKQEKKINQSLN